MFPTLKKMFKTCQNGANLFTVTTGVAKGPLARAEFSGVFRTCTEVFQVENQAFPLKMRFLVGLTRKWKFKKCQNGANPSLVTPDIEKGPLARAESSGAFRTCADVIFRRKSWFSSENVVFGGFDKEGDAPKVSEWCQSLPWHPRH